MATVAAIALAVPAAAEDQGKPLEKTQQETTEQPEKAPAGVDQQGQGAAAEGQPAAQPPVTAEEPPAAQAPEQDVAEEEPAPPADMKFIEVQDEAQFLAEDEVIGKGVVNTTDEEVGTISDLVMDQNQKLVGVVLSVGGFLGIGDKWVAIPVDQIEFPTAEEPARLLAAVTEEQLKNAPDFMTRQEVEAEKAAEQAQQQAMQQQQQTPAPAASSQ
jgi:hypothetical protein